VNSAVVAACAVAAQLGAGDALGIIRWDGPRDARAWTTLLTWLAFSYALAVLAGALVGRLAVRRHRGADSFGSRLTAALVAALGAGAAVGLAWLPAQSLQPPTNVDAGLVVALTASAGVLVGLILALLALSARPVAVGLQATAAWIWLVAIGATVAELSSDAQTYPAPRVAMLDAPSVLPASPWTGPRMMIIVAAAVGLVVSGVARWRGSGRLGAALAGFGGPAVVAAAYLVAGPGPAGDPASQRDPYLAALFAVGAGLVASVLVAMPGRRTAHTPQPAAPVDDRPLEGDVLEVVRAATAPIPAQGRDRPAWASGSGPYAGAFSGATGRASVPIHEPVTVAARGTGWDAATLAGATRAASVSVGTITGTASVGRHADPQETPGSSGLYRSGGTSVEAAYESGRHAAAE
jgi:hypothetical protein